MNSPLGLVTLRDATSDDADFLRRLALEARAAELAELGETAQRAALFEHDQLSRERPLPPPPAAENDHLILLGDEPVGRLWLDEHGGALWIVELTLLPERRGGGLGTTVLRALMERVRAEGRPLALYTESGGRPHGLYLRLGFRAIGERGMHVALEWRPGAPTPG